MKNRKKMPLDFNEKKSTDSAPRINDGLAAPYASFAVARDGSRQAIDAHRLVICVGSDEIEIDLTIPHVLLAGQVRVAVCGERVLVVGHGDASSIYVSAVPFGGSRLKQR